MSKTSQLKRYFLRTHLHTLLFAKKETHNKNLNNVTQTNKGVGKKYPEGCGANGKTKTET